MEDVPQPVIRDATGIKTEVCLVFLFLSMLTLLGGGKDFEKILLAGLVVFIVYLLIKIRNLPWEDFVAEENKRENPMDPYLP